MTLTAEALQWFVLLGLSPVFLAQALHLRRTVPKLPEPGCPRQGSVGSGSDFRILILGDSAGAGVGSPLQSEAFCGQLVGELKNDFHVHWTIHAKTGWTTQDCLDNLEDLKAQRFDAVVTSLGVNDVTGLVPTATWLLRQEVLYWRVRERFERPHIYFSGTPPMGRFPALPQPLRWWLGMRATSLSEALRQWTKGREGCSYVPLVAPFTSDTMASDGFHPGPSLCTIWASLVAQEIRKIEEVGGPTTRSENRLEVSQEDGH